MILFRSALRDGAVHNTLVVRGFAKRCLLLGRSFSICIDPIASLLMRDVGTAMSSGDFVGHTMV